MAAHIAQEAQQHKLPKGGCKVCDRGAVKRNQVCCRGQEPLNGQDAAWEFSRSLLPAVRSRLIDRPVDHRGAGL